MRGMVSIGSQDALVYGFRKHEHTTWEVTYYYDGEGKNVTGGVEYDFSSGTIICQPPGVPHEDIAPKGYRNIFFLVKEFSIPSKNPIVVQDTDSKDFLHILRQLYTEFHINGNNPVTAALLNVEHEYLQRFLEGHRTNKYVEIFERKLINEFYNPNLSIDEQMDDIPFSVNHFRKIFEKETGISPYRYLMNLRLNHAKNLLENSTLKVKQIAQVSGFSDQYYFSRVFSKYMGKGPSEWRKESKEHNDGQE